MALTEKQAHELQQVIDQRRSHLIAEVRDDLARARQDSLGELAGPAPDPGDESVATLIQDLDQADASRDANELRDLEAASARLASGAYGICVVCGTDISYERLRAQPSALRCIQCQENYEKTHAVTGRPTL
jgi:RNA polymerase-binding transcription factor DksA